MLYHRKNARRDASSKSPGAVHAARRDVGRVRLDAEQELRTGQHQFDCVFNPASKFPRLRPSWKKLSRLSMSVSETGLR